MLPPMAQDEVVQGEAVQDSSFYRTESLTSSFKGGEGSAVKRA